MKPPVQITEEEAHTLLDVFEAAHPEIHQNVTYFKRFTRRMARELIAAYGFDDPLLYAALRWAARGLGKSTPADALVHFAVRDLFRAYQANSEVSNAERILRSAWFLHPDRVVYRTTTNFNVQMQGIEDSERYFFMEHGKTRFQAHVDTLRAAGFVVTTLDDEIIVEAPDKETEARILKMLDEMFTPNFIHPDLVRGDVVTERCWKK